MERPETSYADISTPDKSEALISLLDEYIDEIENLYSALEIAHKGKLAQAELISRNQLKAKEEKIEKLKAICMRLASSVDDKLNLVTSAPELLGALNEIIGCTDIVDAIYIALEATRKASNIK